MSHPEVDKWLPRVAEIITLVREKEADLAADRIIEATEHQASAQAVVAILVALVAAEVDPDVLSRYALVVAGRTDGE